jgi:D-alanine transaminase
MQPIVYLNGSYLAKDEARLSPDDRGFLFADGVYEVVRSYGGKLFAMEPHLKRMADGLRALRIEGFDPHTLGSVCTELLERNDLSDRDALIYMQVSRGAAPRIHAFPEPSVTPTVYAVPSAFTPKVDAAVGVPVITTPDMRWMRCDIKSVALLPNCLAAQEAKERGAPEAILIRDGIALEGTHTSFFGVIDGVVRTAPLSNYILPSITRAVAVELCETHDIPIREYPILQQELDTADELMLVGTTVEIMPIVSVDGRQVGNGKPGPVARRLGELFGEYRVQGSG